MAALADQPDLVRKLSGQAHRWIADRNLTWRNNAEQYMRIYRRITEKGM
jgi:glycosyltransferase involved in cell wall biosynthesis